MLRKLMLSSYVPSMGFSSASAPTVLKCGDKLNQARKFFTPDVVEYSKLSYDSNPLHFDSECARSAGFQDILVPGMLVASLFPRIIASHFTGILFGTEGVALLSVCVSDGIGLILQPGAVYVSQTLHFKSPVYIDEEVTSEVQATSIKQLKSKYIAKFSTKCFKNNGLLVVDGEATAILPTLSLAQVEN